MMMMTMMMDGGNVKCWSSTQATVAQSSGEAEYCAMVRAAAEALNMQDLGWDAKITIWADSSAAKSIASRIGLGKVRHMEVKFLWLQEAVKSKRTEVKRIVGVENPSDVLTKPKSYREVAGLLQKVGVKIEDHKLADDVGLVDFQKACRQRKTESISGQRESYWCP